MSKRKAHSSSGGRAKAVSILMREEMKSDKRHAVADALATKLKSKYAKQDPQFADSIASMVNRLLHSHQRILESDIVTLEAVVKKMSLERQSQRSNSATRSTGGFTHANNTRPGGEASHQMKVNSSSEQSASNANGGGPRSNHHSLVSELKNQDEWVLLNALTLVEVESEKEREKAKMLEKRQLQRAWLDAQQAEKAAYRELEKREGQLQYQHQMRDISNWQESESMKKQHQLDQVMKVRRERDEQLRQQKLKLEQMVLKKKQEDAAEVERVQRELKRLDDEAQRRRIQEHERMKKLQIENSAVQREKGHIKCREQQEDVKLMEAYARRLAREDEERMQALQGKLKQRDHTQHKIAESIQMQMRQKTLEDEKRAEEYQRKKDEAAIQKEQEAQEKRRKEALERQQFLHVQRAQKNQRERQEIDDDLSFAEQYHGEARAAIATQKRQLSYVRQQNRAFQEQLVLQMEEQRKGQPMSPLHLPRTLMNSRERNINAKLLQKLEQPEITQKVLQKLSPSKDVTHPIITTTFY